MSSTVGDTMADGGQHQDKQRADVTEKAPPGQGSGSSARMSNALLRLQRTAGNRSAAAFAQTKLVVGTAADPAEYEADAIADEVLTRLRLPDGGVDGDDHDGDARAPTIRRSVGGGADPLGGVELDGQTHADIERARSSGRSMSGGVRRRMEQGF